MNGRERFLIALNNGKPDRLPCQVHSWMKYYLNTYLNGMDEYQAYEYFDMDPVIYAVPNLIYSERDLKNWAEEYKSFGVDADGQERFEFVYHTPEGDLTVKGARNKFTSWETEHMIKTESDFELFKKYYPVPIKADWSPIIEAKRRIGDKGIVRTWCQNYGQPGVWQSLTCLIGTENAIFKAIDEPDWTHYALKVISEKSLKTIENMGKIEADLVENGGGSASSTVISPAIHEEFCLPYDKLQHDAIHRQGALVVYHLCGGLMPLLEIAQKNGMDALETMTPASMGGDCRMEEAAQRIGDSVAFIGGFDQNEGLERGNKQFIESEVQRLFKAKSNGGYICCPSDHFFFGEPENVKLFVNACKQCKY
ncbi:MAG: hypothetical protein IKC36_03370 [Clostridia bacterium]|nr:hypothetical protein [Clostridia bacterium]